MQIVGVTADLMVEGVDSAHGAGRFQGRVIAVAFADGPDRHAPSPSATWLLVVDEEQPAPLWVAQSDVTAQRLGR
jgi:hypothetical protein